MEPHPTGEAAMGITGMEVCVPVEWSDEQIIGFADQVQPTPTLMGFVTCEDVKARRYCPDDHGFWYVWVGC